jgi:hypothetical protein
MLTKRASNGDATLESRCAAVAQRTPWPPSSLRPASGLISHPASAPHQLATPGTVRPPRLLPEPHLFPLGRWQAPGSRRPTTLGWLNTTSDRSSDESSRTESDAVVARDSLFRSGPHQPGLHASAEVWGRGHDFESRRPTRLREDPLRDRNGKVGRIYRVTYSAAAKGRLSISTPLDRLLYERT